ncbi:hypothetical protein Ddc_05386 [Ditylenchus destructor]|nr:hypothetical protein Ddc_05386 [Ditylenchus destructor]
MPSKGRGKNIFRKFGPNRSANQQYGRYLTAPAESRMTPELPELEAISDTEEESQQGLDNNEIPDEIVADHGGFQANDDLEYDQFTNQEWNEAHKNLSLELAFTQVKLEQAQLEIARLKQLQELSGSISCHQCRGTLKRKERDADEETPQLKKRARTSPRVEQIPEDLFENRAPTVIQQLPAETDEPLFLGYTAYFERIADDDSKAGDNQGS